MSPSTSSGHVPMVGNMEWILDPATPDSEISDFLTALHKKGETAEDLVGALTSLRQKMVRLPLVNPDAIDTCGTGGDGKGTFNISTASAFVIAGAGVTVAKHGNRAVTSKSGSADVLKALGVNLDASPQIVEQCIKQIGIGFLFAPSYHPALKRVAPIRQKLKTRTIFNLLGPLLNPMEVKRQVIGVYEAKWIPIFLETLQKLGTKKAAVVHGTDGLDEITLTGTTQIGYLEEGAIRTETFDPRKLGYVFCSPSDLKGGDAVANAKRLRQVLKGHSKPLDHCVHLNAALGIYVAGKATEFKDAVLMVQESISSNRAYRKLEELIELTNQK